jgi:PAS domain S-box-containing protein
MLLDDHDSLVLVVDGEGRIVEAGAAARRLLEEGDGLIGMHIGAILDEGERPGELAEALGVATELSVARRLLPTGHPRDISTVALRVRMRGGTFAEFMFRFRHSPTDELWLLRGQQARSPMTPDAGSPPPRSEPRYNMAPRFDISRSSVPVMISDARTRTIIAVSPGIERLFGWTNEEARGRSTSLIYMDGEYFRKLGKKADEAYQDQGFLAGIVQVLRKDGDATQCSFLNIPLYDGQEVEPTWILTFIDEHIREWKRQQDIGRLAEAARNLADELRQVSGESVAIWNSIIRLSGLSSRQKEIIFLVKDGSSTKQIAERLGLKESTVKNHLSSAYKKIGVKSRTELVRNLYQKP